MIGAIFSTIYDYKKAKRIKRKKKKQEKAREEKKRRDEERKEEYEKTHANNQWYDRYYPRYKKNSWQGYYEDRYQLYTDTDEDKDLNNKIKYSKYSEDTLNNTAGAILFCGENLPKVKIEKGINNIFWFSCFIPIIISGIITGVPVIKKLWMWLMEGFCGSLILRFDLDNIILLALIELVIVAIILLGGAAVFFITTGIIGIFDAAILMIIDKLYGNFSGISSEINSTAERIKYEYKNILKFQDLIKYRNNDQFATYVDNFDNDISRIRYEAPDYFRSVKWYLYSEGVTIWSEKCDSDRSSNADGYQIYASDKCEREGRPEPAVATIHLMEKSVYYNSKDNELLQTCHLHNLNISKEYSDIIADDGTIDFTVLDDKIEETCKRFKELGDYGEMSPLRIIKGIIRGTVISVILIALIAINIFIPIGMHYGFKQLNKTTEYSKNDTVDEDNEDTNTEYLIDEDINVITITKDNSRIRLGADTSYRTIETASKGTVFAGTGNQKIGDYEKIWYEVYIDNEMTQTGWVSEDYVKLNKDN